MAKLDFLRSRLRRIDSLYDLFNMGLRSWYGPIQAFKIVLVEHLIAEDLLELRRHIKLEVRRQDLDLLKLELLLLDTAELASSQQPHIETDAGQYNHSDNDTEDRCLLFDRLLKADDGDPVAILVYLPLDVEAVFSHEELSDCPVVAMFTKFRDVREAIFEVPKT